MPEGPELHLASCYVNTQCKDLVFAGRVEKSEVTKNPEVPFESSAYRITATSRGKEVRLTLSPLPGARPPQPPLDLVFRFGMSGSFQVVPADALPKHAHLRFYTASPPPRRALCFVDIRRFGHWEVQGTWQPGRGPCVLLEYEKFRENVLQNLADKTFDKPICEALLDQKFFNGIGNYLRAEILHRLKIPPFEKARTVLEALKCWRPGDPGPLAPKGGKSRKKRVKEKSIPEVTDSEDPKSLPKKGLTRARKPGKKSQKGSVDQGTKGHEASTRRPKSQPRLKRRKSAPTSPGSDPGVLEGKQQLVARVRKARTRKGKATSKPRLSPSSSPPPSPSGHPEPGLSPP
uniref:DNA-(apurinic or apyrimidinic site) lyase n=1 Tax=Sarcophilus harrisii TaxID=9305 RepID=G3VI40_SARHA